MCINTVSFILYLRTTLSSLSRGILPYMEPKRLAAVNLLITFFVLSSPRCSSQSLPYLHYTTRDGLMSDWVTALAQDTRGYLWIGTSEGLSRFDGVSFINYTTKDGLASNYIECLLENRSQPGTMLVGTHGGVTILGSNGARTIKVPSAASVTDVLCDAKGVVWLGTRDGLYSLADSSVQKFENLEPVDIRDLEESVDGSLYIAGDSHLIFVRSNRKEIVKLSVEIPAGSVVASFCADADGSVWAATDNGLLFHVRDSVVIGTFRLMEDWIPALLDGGDGILWACTMSGIIRIPKRTPEHAILMPPPGAFRALRDREGNIWRAGEGLLMLPSSQVTVFPDTVGGSDLTQPSQMTDRQGHVWSVSKGGLIEYWQGEHGAWQRAMHLLPDTMQPNWVSIDLRNRLWLGSRKQSTLSSFVIESRDLRKSALRREKELNVGVVPHYFNTREPDEIWIGSPGAPALQCFETKSGSRIKTFSPPSPDFGPRCSMVDRGNTLWIGEFDNGVFYTPVDSPSAWKMITVNGGLLDNHIRSLLEDSDGSVWIGTRYGGVAVRRNNGIEVFDTKDGLPGNWVHGMYQDSSGRMWFCTSLGLAYLEHPSTSAFQTLPLLHGQDILRMGEIKRNVYWIRTAQRMVFYDFGAESKHETNPLVSISSVEMNGVPFPGQDFAEFDHTQNLFSVKYSGIYFKDPRRIRYTYRLEGVDNAWHEPTNEKSVSYSNLVPGKYLFSVKAITGNGVESPNAATVQFVIAPALWQRWWFRLLLAVLLLSVAPIAYIGRVNKLRRRNLLQEQFSRRLIESQENERKRIAASLHDSLGQNLILSKNYAMLGLKTAREPASREHLNEISSLLTQSLDEVREIAYNLRPHHLDRIGLTRTIEFIIDKVKHSTSIQCWAEVENIDHLLPPEGEINFYRIVQESLNNIVKHSFATTMRCRIQKKEGHVHMEIVDNGRGFDRRTIETGEDSAKGFGLSGMAERIRLLDGTLQVDSRPHQGTTLTFKIPYKVS